MGRDLDPVQVGLLVHLQFNLLQAQKQAAALLLFHINFCVKVRFDIYHKTVIRPSSVDDKPLLLALSCNIASTLQYLCNDQMHNSNNCQVSMSLHCMS